MFQLTEVLDESAITASTMYWFGQIKANLEERGCRIADADIIIAATALESGITLVTGNLKHFSRVDGIKLENWFSN